MVGPRGEYLYQVLGSTGASRMNATCFCDTQAPTLTFGVQSNEPAAPNTPAATGLFRVPVRPGVNSLNLNARCFLVRYVGGAPAPRTSDLVWVPIFKIAFYNSKDIGSFGTLNGLDVELIRKHKGPDSL